MKKLFKSIIKVFALVTLMTVINEEVFAEKKILYLKMRGGSQ